ncbi:CarD family transcriptional regulator [Brevibacillus massiliensis]|uniref:CarD family transcriptional regulator n=2 Tax=Brevibacillus massiliensis TaxID=1118054 RepID=UPI0021C31394|nr:CarD family transcriptional regulator [Brevibacillus massiliensis]
MVKLKFFITKPNYVILIAGGVGMFQVGDKIFYPIHGAGIIEAIEEKNFLGENHLYYVLNMLLRELHIMVPVEKISSLGIRQIVDSTVMERVLASFHEGEPEVMANANLRFRINTDKLKSGDIHAAAEVIRELLWISKQKGLGTGERMMLDHAQQVFMSELALVKGIDAEEAFDLLRQAIEH